MDSESTLAMIQASAFHQQFFSGSSLPEIFLNDEHRKSVSHRPQSPEKASGLEMNFRISNCSAVSGPTNGLGFQVPAYNLCEEGHSVIGFKPEFRDFIHNGTLVNFELNTNVMPTFNLYARMTSQEDEYNSWMNFPNCFAADNILSETSSFHHAAVRLNDRENVINKGIQELGRRDTIKNKRTSMGDGVQEHKKPCVVSSTNPKSELTAKKDPLISIAAKNRRERISARLKALQELVPNGSKVDLVTMLEKAISYVKFLQLQVKVLATDEFWPSQGGKAPELCQVKEAIDAILGS